MGRVIIGFSPPKQEIAKGGGGGYLLNYEMVRPARFGAAPPLAKCASDISSDLGDGDSAMGGPGNNIGRRDIIGLQGSLFPSAMDG